LRGKFKFAGGNIKETFDLKRRQHSFNFKNHNNNVWFNPYLETTIGRNLQKNSLSLGLLTHFNSHWMENVRVNFTKADDKCCNADADFHLRYSKKCFTANAFLNFSLCDFLSGTNTKLFSLEFAKNNVHFSLSSS
jgi:hypothetical protein